MDAMQGLKLLITIVAVFLKSPDSVNAHGRIWEPPGRSTLWRLAEFQNLESPPLENYDDDQLYCGGIGKLIANGGKCGPCGDEYGLPKPRDNENGGVYGRGVIARHYSTGQKIDIAVELTANHWGYFEFRLCPLQSKNVPEPDDCFDKYLLELADGYVSHETRYNITTNGPGWFNTSVLLPPNVTGRAVLQWHYRAGNSWNPCKDQKSEHGQEMVGATGCGDQEIFRGCSDIFIHGSAAPAPAPKPAVVANKPPQPPQEVTTPSIETKPKRPKATIPPMRPPKVPS